MMSHDQNVLERISDIIAEAANQENFRNLETNLKEAVSDLPPDSKEAAINDAFIYVISVSQPGYMPDAFGYNSSGDDVRQSLLYEIGLSEDTVDDTDPAYDDIMTEFELIRKDIERASEEVLRKGATIHLPINQVIELSTMGCGEWLDNNGLWPELEDEADCEEDDRSVELRQ